MTLVQEIVVLRSKFNAPAGDGNLLQGRSNLELERGRVMTIESLSNQFAALACVQNNPRLTF